MAEIELGEHSVDVRRRNVSSYQYEIRLHYTKGDGDDYTLKVSFIRLMGSDAPSSRSELDNTTLQHAASELWDILVAQGIAEEIDEVIGLRVNERTTVRKTHD